MDRYAVQEKLGDGTFGTVFRAIHSRSLKEVAIKRMKRRFKSWEDIVKLREFRSLYEMNSFHHPNIVELHEVIRDSNEQLFFVFEYMPGGNLYEFIKHHTPPKSLGRKDTTPTPVLSETRIRFIAKQVLEGLEFLHSRGYFHRDIKPENILMRGDVCKLADFGLARDCKCEAPVTDYVSTRWYRAPEVLLRSSEYGKPVDLFGLGCIIAELYSRVPLFPGENEVDQIHLITQVLGTPESDWAEGVNLATKLGINLKCDKQIALQDKVPGLSRDALLLMNNLLKWNPKDRPTCKQALSHNYFALKSTPNVDPSMLCSLRNKRSLIAASLEDQNQNIPAKVRRVDDSSPRSVHDIWDNAFTIPNPPFFY
mmetsp:Transcript_10151/g.15582  ORF Transcript_10151/g.15582 Transcript_10151/m.15582 type:complete len:367 (-) Transcript_10151:2153-3253(-)|eukprot:CAMPEP_0178899572 /NCGR_PEP_ID=MMETSP0786-20121207/2981_1 /TAXON_ID=186022 /ORGANISM="Thalassionema frauenfeldii, Strain CCMP 1798" /LENGTH=366 /DNA_ID=CAMNT_0020570457 /DNA_START=58 /DNA_END=1158 /DNA_ORIENTATION=+